MTKKNDASAALKQALAGTQVGSSTLQDEEEDHTPPMKEIKAAPDSATTDERKDKVSVILYGEELDLLYELDDVLRAEGERDAAKAQLLRVALAVASRNPSKVLKAYQEIKARDKRRSVKP